MLTIFYGYYRSLIKFSVEEIKILVIMTILRKITIILFKLGNISVFLTVNYVYRFINHAFFSMYYQKI